jgi:RND superfamily putative drug exporter
MNAWAELVVRHKKTAFFSFVAIILLSTVWGFQSFGNLKAGGYDDPTSSSARVTQLLSKEFKTEIPNIVLIADMPDFVDAAESQKIGADLTAKLKTYEGVTDVSSYYSLGNAPSLRSDDGKAAYFFVKTDKKYVETEIGAKVAHELTGDFEKAKVYVAGFAAISTAISEQISSDLGAAETIAIPLTLLLLIFVFGSLVAAGLPMLVGGLAIMGSFFFVWISTQITDTSIFSVNLITGMGLGLGIDYALLMVNRFREERAAGHEVNQAVIRTVNSAGRTVLFSGLTVAIVLAAMFFFPQYFLKSFALGGVVVVILAIAGALIALPALLAMLGDKVNLIKLTRITAKARTKGSWASLARFVMKRPLPILLVTLIGLGGLMTLMNGVQFGQVDDRILPASNKAVIANNVIRERFSGREGSPVEILVKGADTNDIYDFTNELSKTGHILRVQSALGITQDGQLDSSYAPAFAAFSNSNWQRIQAIADLEPRSPDGQKLTEAIRKLKVDHHEVLVGGTAAIYTDSQLGITKQLPTVLLWIVLWTLVLLFLFTGSVLLPIKAVLLNFISLGATLGFLTWVFVDGNLKWLIGDFQVTGTIDTSSLVLIAIVAFGLSMDYELFLLSRIKEQHDTGLGTTESVAIGLQRSGRIITTAALVLAFSFAAFVSSGVSIMKMLGLGIAFAILLDATVVRALLVPALMRLFGDLNWWAPKWLKAVYRRVGLEH